MSGPSPFGSSSGVFEAEIFITANKPSDDNISNQTFDSLWKDTFHLTASNGAFFEILGSDSNPIPDNVFKHDSVWIIVKDQFSPSHVSFEFNISKKDQKRLLLLNNFFSNKINNKTFSKNNLQKILYFNEKQSLLDLINFQIFKSKKVDKKLLGMIEFFKDKEPPLLPVGAITLMNKYNIPEGKKLGIMIKKIEKKWLDNNFQISENEIQKLIKN